MSNAHLSRPHFRVGGTLDTIDADRATILERRREEINDTFFEDTLVLVAPSPFYASILASLEVMGPATAPAIASDVAYLHYDDSTLRVVPGTENKRHPESITNRVSAILTGLVDKTPLVQLQLINRQSGTEIPGSETSNMSPDDFRKSLFLVYSSGEPDETDNGKYVDAISPILSPNIAIA